MAICYKYLKVFYLSNKTEESEEVFSPRFSKNLGERIIKILCKFLYNQIHGETIQRQSNLQDKAKELVEVQCAEWQRVDKLFQSSRCMITFISNSKFQL